MIDSSVIAPQEGPQTALIQCPYRDIFYGGARGGGKTFGTILKWHDHHEKYGRHARGLVLRRTYPQLDSFIKEARDVLGELGWIYRKQAKKFVHRDTDAELLLRFMETDDDADNFLGHQYTFMVIEEMGDFPTEDAIRKVRATLRSAQGVPTQFMGTGNPGGKGHKWIYESYIKPTDAFTPHLDLKTGQAKIFIPSLLENNRILMDNDPDYERTLLGAGPDWLIRAWRHGDWSVSPEGNAFKREHFKYYTVPPPYFIRIAQSWDTAYKDKKNCDRSACTTWGVTENAYYLLHAWAGRVEFPELKKIAKELCWRFAPHVIYVEDKASGTSLVQELRRDTRMPIRAVPVDANKLARAYAVTPLFAAGKIFVPEGEPWLYDYIDELTSFPARDEDDYVDSTSQGLSRLSHFQKLLENNPSNVVPFEGSIWSV